MEPATYSLKNQDMGQDYSFYFFGFSEQSFKDLKFLHFKNRIVML